MIKLTKAQEAALPGIQFLIDDSLGIGKSYLLAHAFIEKAIKSRQWTPVWDHTPGSMMISRMLTKIVEVVHDHYQDYEVIVNATHGAVKVLKK